MTPPLRLGSRLDAGVLHLRLARPERKNALDGAAYLALAQALQQARGNDAVRAVALTAEGATFSAGNDLADFTPADAFTPSAPAFAFMRALAGFPKPLVAGVQGAAVGIGFTMLLHFDIVLAADDAYFIAPFVDLGVCPEAASTLLLTRAIGLARASEMLLTGRTLHAEEARQIGLASRVVPTASLAGAVDDCALALAAKPAAALTATKFLLRHEDSIDADERIGREAQLFCELLRGLAAVEALAVRREKRRPDFSSL